MITTIFIKILFFCLVNRIIMFSDKNNFQYFKSGDIFGFCCVEKKSNVLDAFIRSSEVLSIRIYNTALFSNSCYHVSKSVY